MTEKKIDQIIEEKEQQELEEALSSSTVESIINSIQQLTGDLNKIVEYLDNNHNKIMANTTKKELKDLHKERKKLVDKASMLSCRKNKAIKILLMLINT